MKLLYSLLLVLAFAQFSFAVDPPALGEAWKLQSPGPTSEILLAVATDGTTNMVAVGEHGTILSKNPPADWTLRPVIDTVPITANLTDVVWSSVQGKYLAVGASSTCLKSTDGVAWTKEEMAVKTDQFNAVAATSASKLVIVGGTTTGAGVILTYDSANWTRRVITGATTFKDVVWTGTTLFAVCANKVFSSTDGAVWTGKALATTPASIAFVPGDNVAVPPIPAALVLIGSKSWKSLDEGGTWTAITPPSPDLVINTVGSELVGANNRGEVWSSIDKGTTWQARLVSQYIQFNAATKFGDFYVVVGDGGVIQNSNGVAADALLQRQILTPALDKKLLSMTTDGASVAVAVGAGGAIVKGTAYNAWAASTSGVTTDLAKVIWTGTKFVAVGDGGVILTSLDGASWLRSTSPNPTFKLNGLTRNGTQLLAVGEQAGVGVVIVSTTDGDTWTTSTITAKKELVSIPVPPIIDVTVSGTKYVAAATGYLLTSDDGLAWKATPLPGSIPQRITIGLSGIVIISGNKTYRYDPVSLHLEQLSPPATMRIEWVVDRYIGVSATGEIWSSTDNCSTWQIQSSAQNAGLYGAGKFDNHQVVVGAAGLVETYADAGTTETLWSGRTAETNSVAWNQQSGALARYVAVGWDTSWTGVKSTAVGAQESDIQWTSGRLGNTTNRFLAMQVIWSPVASQFVAVGGAIWTSADNGQSWVNRLNGPGTSPSINTVTEMGGKLYAFAYNNTQKQIYIATSSDGGLTWPSGFVGLTGAAGQINPPGYQWNMLSAAKATGDYYLAVGWSGHYLVSGTGAPTQWGEGILKLPYANEDFTTVVWSPELGRFVIGTNYGGFWAFDGSRFTKARVWKHNALGAWQQTSDGQGSRAIWSIKRVAGEFIAVGNGGLIWKSFNGLDWREYTPYEAGGSGTPNFLYDVVFADTDVPVPPVAPATTSTTKPERGIIAVGGLGTIITSGGVDVPAQPEIRFKPDEHTITDNSFTSVNVTISKRLFPGTLTVPLIIGGTASSRFKSNVSSVIFTDSETSKSFTIKGIPSARLDAPVDLYFTTTKLVGGDLKQVNDTYIPDLSKPTEIFNRGFLTLTDADQLNDVSFETVAATRTEGEFIDLKVNLVRPVTNENVIMPLIFGGVVAPTDYTRPAGNVVIIKKNETSATVRITLKDDTLAKTTSSARTITVTLGQPTKLASVGKDHIFTITVLDNDTAPVITTQPVSQLVSAGDSVTFSAIVTPGRVNATPVDYNAQWLKNGVAIPGFPAQNYSASGSASPTITLPSATLANAGTYSLQVTAVPSNVSSNAVNLGVVDRQPKSFTIKSGGSLTLTAPAAGSGLTYQWQLAGIAMPGEKRSTLQLNNILSDSDKFTCRIGLSSLPTSIVSGEFKVETSTEAPIIDLTGWVDNTEVAVDYAFTPVPATTASKKASKWVITNLPLGLVYDPTTGAISGRATKPGTFQVTFAASNATGSAVPQKKTLTVRALAAGLAGRFTGTIKEQATVNKGLGGLLDLTVTSTGDFTGKITDGLQPAEADSSGAVAFIGKLGGLGATRTATIVVGTRTITITALNSALGTLTGTVSIGSDSADVTGWYRTAAPSTRSGYYTCAFAHNTPETGYGFSSFTIAADGSVTGKVTMADLTTRTFSTVVGPGRQIPVFGLLKNNAGESGSAMGELLVAEGSPAPTKNSLTGAMGWIKAAATPGPSAPLTTDGGRYFAPTAAQLVMTLPTPATANNLSVVFAGADLVAGANSPTGVFSVKLGAVVTAPTTNPAGTSLGFTAATGEFGGQFTDLFGTDHTRSAEFRGLLIRPSGGDTMVGRGAFTVGAEPSSNAKLTGSVALSRATH